HPVRVHHSFLLLPLIPHSQHQLSQHSFPTRRSSDLAMGLFDKIKKIGIFSGFSQLDDDFYDQLEESLVMADMGAQTTLEAVEELDRKSTRLNSSHVSISYAVFCLKNKKIIKPLPIFL